MTHENSMNESEIRGLIDQVRDNSLTRKQFIRHMIGAGLTVPMAAQMLLTSGLAQAQTASNYKPTKRGGGGALKFSGGKVLLCFNPTSPVVPKTKKAHVFSMSL